MQPSARLALAFTSSLAGVFASAAFAAPPAETPAGAAGAPAEKSAPLIAPPAPGGLTADEAARRAAATSHQVKARAEERAAADAAVGQAAAGYLPRLSGVARYTRLSGIEQPSLGTLVVAPPGTDNPIPAGTPLYAAPLSFPVILDQYLTQATLQVPLSDYLYRLPRLHDAAKGNARAAALLAEGARRGSARDARLAYYNWARVRLQSEVAARALATARAHLKDVEAAHAAGVSSKADVLRVASQVAGAELGLARARAATEVGERRLRVLLHDAEDARYEIGEDLAAVPGPLQVEPQGVLVAEAIANRPESRALAESAAALRAQAGATRAAGLPRIDAVANASYARPNGRIFPARDEFRGTWDASVQLSWAPTDLFGSEAGQKAAAARARALEAERAALADGIAVEIAGAVAALRESETAVDAAARGLEAAAESYRVRRALYQNGRATSVELTDAETENARAELEAISTRIERRIAEVRLVHAIGRDR